MFNPANQLVADNLGFQYKDNGELRTDVLQPNVDRLGKPTGKLSNTTADAEWAYQIFWTLEHTELKKPGGIWDRQIELETINEILNNKEKLETFKMRLGTYESDGKIKEALNLLKDFQSEYGSDSKLTYGQFREAYYDRDGSFHEEMKKNPEAQRVLDSLVNGKW